MTRFAAALILFAAAALPARATPAPKGHPPGVPVMMFAWPVCASRAEGFGYRVDPQTQRVAFHAGLDLETPAGTPVRAGASGQVTAAERRGPYGLLIEIDHGSGYRTRYGHLGQARVVPGEAVGRGQVIGASGASGRTSGPQLHFEVWLNEVVRDPRRYLERDGACGGR